MKKLSYILTATLTFFLSATVYFVYLNFQINQSKSLIDSVESSSIPLISLCEVTNSHEFYKNRNVRIRGYMSGKDGDGYFFTKDNGYCEHYKIRISFWLEENFKAQAEEIFKKLTYEHSNGFKTVVNIEVVGELEDEGLGYDRFSIKVKEIKQIPSPTKLTD